MSNTKDGKWKHASSRSANGDDIARQQAITRDLAPLALPMHHDGLLGCLKRPQLLQVPQPLSHHCALKHDQHAQREKGVIPTVQSDFSVKPGHRLVQHLSHSVFKREKHAQHEDNVNAMQF